MRTRDEVERALTLLRRYRGSQRPKAISHDTVMNMIGVEAALEWLLGDDGGPVANTLRDMGRWPE